MNGLVQTAPVANGAVTDKSPAGTQHFENYGAGLIDVFAHMPWNVVAQVGVLLVSAWSEGRSVLIFGNGGSASTAHHMAADLSKNTTRPGERRLRAQCLTDNTALFSALANDNGYAEAFADEIEIYGDAGDVVIAISASGNSPNVLQAVQLATKKGLSTIGITGYEGGKLVHSAELCVVVPCDDIEKIEDMHMVLVHMLTSYVRNAIRTQLESTE